MKLGLCYSSKNFKNNLQNSRSKPSRLCQNQEQRKGINLGELIKIKQISTEESMNVLQCISNVLQQKY